MAKLQGAMHSDHARGSVSGVTYREYRGMPTATRRPRPVRRWRVGQLGIRSILGYLARDWGNRTPTERDLWLAWAQLHPQPDGFGGTFQLDGNQAYIKLNHTAIRLGGDDAKKTEPPLDEPPATVLTLVVKTGNGNGEIDLDWTHAGVPVAADYNEIQVAGPFGSPGRTAVQGRYRFWDTVIGTTIAKAVTGLVPDAWYWFRVRYVDIDGQVTNWISGQAKAKKVA